MFDLLNESNLKILKTLSDWKDTIPAVGQFQIHSMNIFLAQKPLAAIIFHHPMPKKWTCALHKCTCAFSSLVPY
jgi:hypothetical protein